MASEETAGKDSSRAGRFGPGLVITAAFIGPGTVITCTAAGAAFGPALLWTLLFAGITVLVLQEMSMRLGLSTGKDLAQMLRESSGNRWLRAAAGFLVAGAILIGCAAYQAGNLVGGAAGLSALLGGDLRAWALLQCAVGAVLLWTGRYKAIERVLIALVAVMSMCFVVTAVVFAPRVPQLASGLLTPVIPEAGLLTVLALIGTTVVPYNLFLHSRIVGEKWGTGRGALRTARLDVLFAVGIGIAVSAGIMITAAGAMKGEGISGIDSVAEPLRIMLGDAGAAVFGVGLWAAGMTSSITAPLAAAYTVSGAAGWPRDSRSKRFRTTWIAVMAVGMAFALLSANPVLLIVAAQALNAVILPVAAVFLIVALNNRRRLGNMANSMPMNVVAMAVLLVVVALSGRYLLQALGII